MIDSYKIIACVFLISLLASCTIKNKEQLVDNESEFHGEFIENFSDTVSNFFRHGTGGKGADFTWKMGVSSSSETDTKVLSFKIDPEDAAGAGKGPEIISKKFTSYGTYAARLKIPDPKNIQPNVGAVVGYFTYRVDSIYGQSEVDFEWLISDPRIIYIGTWTGQRDNSQRIGRTINLAEVIIYDSSYRKRDGSDRMNFTGDQNQPEQIDPIENYDASSQFYTYGFDWHPDHIRWWMIHPITSDTVVLWNYQGSDIGIPNTHTHYRMNFWHTNNWPVHTNPSSIEKPIYPFELEVDWMLYKPME
jgi:beta-glucanase (GH16 family)